MNQCATAHRAKLFCEKNKYRYTEPREKVLSLLADAKKPLGAYQVLDLLSSDSVKINPPTIYRAIEFWNRHGFIHRIESMNAYIACCEGKYHRSFCIFICEKCSKVIELCLPDLTSSMTAQLNVQQLQFSKSTTEIYGQCDRCRSDS